MKPPAPTGAIDVLIGDEKKNEKQKKEEKHRNRERASSPGTLEYIYMLLCVYVYVCKVSHLRNKYLIKLQIKLNQSILSRQDQWIYVTVTGLENRQSTTVKAYILMLAAHIWVSFFFLHLFHYSRCM